ncbi:hypothetical protein G2W53_025292 [Senna tora]|uniref:Uncharacterized protein n=1 Tax=Senna tora TaxID=362788 RepID=A0A834TCX5_9FABA|nr:hypothetical protein G2W53_025292 [Senna tora]
MRRPWTLDEAMGYCSISRYKPESEADDGRDLAEFGIANALRNGETGDGEAGEEVGEEETEIVTRKPLADWHEVLYAFHRSTKRTRLALELPEGIVGKQRLSHRTFQFRAKPSAVREIHRALVACVVCHAIRSDSIRIGKDFVRGREEGDVFIEQV